MKLAHPAALVLCSFFLGSGVGCSTTYRFKVDAVQGGVAAEEARSFRLASADPESVDGDPATERLAGHVRTALSSKGLFEAPQGTEPDMHVEFDFGVDVGGREVETMVWETTDGYEYRRRTVVVHDKFLRITAREPAEGEGAGGGRELWSVYVTNEDAETDPDRYALLLVSVAMDAIGVQTAGEHEFVLAGGDERIEFLRRGL
jgi:hypothetical protein